MDVGQWMTTACQLLLTLREAAYNLLMLLIGSLNGVHRKNNGNKTETSSVYFFNFYLFQLFFLFYLPEIFIFHVISASLLNVSTQGSVIETRNTEANVLQSNKTFGFSHILNDVTN